MKKINLISILMMLIMGTYTAGAQINSNQQKVSESYIEAATDHSHSARSLTAADTLVDSIKVWHWYTSAPDTFWKEYTRQIFNYNSTGTVASETIQYWNNGSWINNNLNTYLYDAHNNLIYGLYQVWSNGTYTNNAQDTLIYDVNSNLLKQISFASWTAGVYQSTTVDTFRYDARNNQISGSHQDVNNGSVGYHTQFSKTYDSHNNLTSYSYSTDPQQSSYQTKQDTYSYDSLNRRTVLNENYTSGTTNGLINEYYTYDINNNLINRVNQTTSSVSGTSYYRDSFTYLGIMLMEHIHQLEFINYCCYINSTYEVYAYDGNNNLISELREVAPPPGSGVSSGVLANTSQTLYTYDANNLRISAVGQEWISTNSTWLNADSTHWYYPNSSTGIKDQSANNISISLYPNPASDKVSISIANATGETNLRITDISGKVVMSRSIRSSDSTIDVRDLKYGVYLFQFQNYQGTITKKVIKL
jgi:hypothetical protein